MKRMLPLLLLSSAVALPAAAALTEGEIAPDFQAPASLAGKAFTFSLKDAMKKGPVVVYFYPSAYTKGCNIEAHEFSVNRDKFTGAGATIIGVSLDSLERLNDFSADPDYCAGKIAVASDASGRIARSFNLSIKEATLGRTDTRGVEIHHDFAERVTFIVTPDGRIAATLAGLAPEANVEKALEVVQKLPPARR